MSGDLARRIVEMAQSAAGTIDPSTYCCLSVILTSSGGHTLYRYEACLCRCHDGAVIAFRTNDGRVAPAGVRLPGCGAAAQAPGAFAIHGGVAGAAAFGYAPPGGAGGCCFFDEVRIELERVAAAAQAAPFGYANGGVSAAVRLEHAEGVEGRRLVGERSCLLSATVPLERGQEGRAALAMKQLQNCVWTVANLVAWQ